MPMIIINYGLLVVLQAFRNSDSITTMPTVIRAVGKPIMFCSIECHRKRQKQSMVKYSKQLSSMAVT